MISMRAKVRISSITPYKTEAGEVQSEALSFNFPAKDGLIPRTAAMKASSSPSSRRPVLPSQTQLAGQVRRRRHVRPGRLISARFPSQSRWLRPAGFFVYRN